MCLDQLLTSKLHNIFNLRNRITKKIAILLDFYLSLPGKHLHRIKLLHIWRRVSLVIGYGRLCSSVTTNFSHTYFHEVSTVKPGPMNGESRPIVVEMVQLRLRNNRLQSRNPRELLIVLEELREYTSTYQKEKRKNVNIYPFGLGNFDRIST
jgi:hypothetical protein